jgi:hypothetical protein
MYRDQKPPESIKTTETHRRTHTITLGAHDVRSILIDTGLQRVGLEKTNGVTVDLFIDGPDERCPATGEHRPTATVTITEDLSKPAITDFAPPNIEEIVRLNPPATPGLSKDQLAQALEEGKRWRKAMGGTGSLNSYDGTAPWCSSSYVPLPIVSDMSESRRPAPSDIVFKTNDQEVMRIPGPIQHLGTTNPTSKLNVDDVDRMDRIAKLHEVLLHGKGNNIVLNRYEVDTLLEILEQRADA